MVFITVLIQSYTVHLLFLLSNVYFNSVEYKRSQRRLITGLTYTIPILFVYLSEQAKAQGTVLYILHIIN